MPSENIYKLDTPSLLLNLHTLEKNVDHIVRFAASHGVNYRPHIKTHKSIDIAKMQMDKGAVGVTVATVGEAEVMTRGGIPNILIAYSIATETKLSRVEALMTQATIILTVDSIEQASLIDRYFKDKHVQVNVWMKVNSGLNRCGVEAEEAVELATHIQTLASLSLQGIFTHAGHSYAATSQEEIEEIAKKEAEAVLTSSELCEKAGISITHKSVGSTPTYQISGAIEGITEVRPGNAIFFDMVQVGLGVAHVEDCALTVLSTVGSVKKDRIVIDAGSKTLHLDKGAHGNESVMGHGYIKEYPHLTLERLSEEHGVIPLKDEIPELRVTDKMTIIPNHACTVVNAFDTYTVHRNGEVIGVWDVHARGRND
ncbi:MAG TPA: alanine racemase [Bacillota bacterium]|nr:alanine racemase [Bacillota bacterium]